MREREREREMFTSPMTCVESKMPRFTAFNYFTLAFTASLILWTYKTLLHCAPFGLPLLGAIIDYKTNISPLGGSENPKHYQVKRFKEIASLIQILRKTK
jgi:hypothetical protein